ncbi:hypothetical protein F5146DRAFT_1119457 [Armillaria mellea]|nr:hypothetical protein F5146DRAFT_1119457 [Armillaria mellea]
MSLKFFVVLAALAAPAFSRPPAVEDGVAPQDPTSPWDTRVVVPECGFQCPKQWPDTDCVWKAVFENKNDWNGWKSGKYTPVTTGYVSKDTFELDCKKLCEAHDKCNSCQAYSMEEQAEQFVCALFEEYIDSATWESDCVADDANSKYFNTSCWSSKS